MAVAVGFAVAVAVAVGFAVDVAVAIGLSVAVAVAAGFGVWVSITSGVAVSKGLTEGRGDGFGVPVGRAVGVGVGDSSIVAGLLCWKGVEAASCARTSAAAARKTVAKTNKRMELIRLIPQKNCSGGR